MKTKKLTMKAMDVASKISTKTFLKQRIKKIDADSSILDTQYICDDSERKVMLTTTLTGLVIGSSVAVYLEDVKIDLDSSGIIGNNKDLNNKKLKIIQNLTADNGTSCILTINLKGGYKDTIHHLSSKVGENGLFFIVYIEFI